MLGSSSTDLKAEPKICKTCGEDEMRRWTYEAKLEVQIEVFLRLQLHNWMISLTQSHSTSVFMKMKTFHKYNNDKPWFTAIIRQLHQAKEEPYRSEDRLLYNKARNTLTMVIRVAKNVLHRKAGKQIFS